MGLGSSAYREGYEAFSDGLCASENPYDEAAEPVEFRDWDSGYVCAIDDWHQLDHGLDEDEESDL